MKIIPASFKLFKNSNITLQYVKNTCNVFPKHNFIRIWMFSCEMQPNVDWIDDEGLIECNLEANLADAMARVAESNGMSANDLQHLFPAVLRMLKSESKWAK